MHFPAFSKVIFRITASLLAALVLLTPSIAAATEKKVLRYAFRTAEDGFDPMKVYDRYSVGIIENIFESPLTYDWLARPVKLAPQLIESIPVPEENGTLYTLRFKRGIYFADDPVFKGQRRELVAKDMEYGIRRFRDPANRSPYEWLFENKVLGLDEAAEKAKKDGKFDYDTPIEGLKVLDRYTLQIRLRSPDYNFLYFLAMPNVVPVSREVIEGYKEDTMAHPVGTGPYVLKEWTRRSKIVLEKNPGYRGHTLSTEFANADDPWDREAIKALAGKTLPLIDRVEIYPIEQEQPRYLAFINFEHDFLEETPFEFVEQVLPNGKLAPNLAKRGASVFREEQMEFTFDLFNMNDPVLGGLTPDKVALRRAMVLAHDRGQEIDIIRRKQAIPAQSPVPPGVVGFDPAFNSSAWLDYNLPRAKALLQMYGYVDKDGDGWREAPDGQPLVLRKMTQSGQTSRELDDLFRRDMKALGIRVEFVVGKWPENLKAARAGKFQIWSVGGVSADPDGMGSFQRYHSKQIGGQNMARYRNERIDAIYDRLSELPDGPERKALFTELKRLSIVHMPYKSHGHRMVTDLVQPWVIGYRRPLFWQDWWQYVDVLSGKDAAA